MAEPSSMEAPGLRRYTTGAGAGAGVRQAERGWSGVPVASSTRNWTSSSGVIASVTRPSFWTEASTTTCTPLWSATVRARMPRARPACGAPNSRTAPVDAGAPAADAIESGATVKAARAARRTDLMRRPRREDTVAAASYIIGPSAADDAVRCEGTGKRRGARGSAPGHSHSMPVPNDGLIAYGPFGGPHCGRTLA